MVTYYDIGLNLFCRQFRDPEKVIEDAKEAGVCCILTGTDSRENQKIDTFVTNSGDSSAQCRQSQKRRL